MAAKVQKIIMGAAVFILSATYAHDGIRLRTVPAARNLNNPIQAARSPLSATICIEQLN